MLTSQWIGAYYVKEDGTMARSEWVDENKYYVDENGVWFLARQQHSGRKTMEVGWYQHADGSYTTNDWESIDGDGIILMHLAI